MIQHSMLRSILEKGTKFRIEEKNEDNITTILNDKAKDHIKTLKSIYKLNNEKCQEIHDYIKNKLKEDKYRSIYPPRIQINRYESSKYPTREPR